MIMQKNLHKVVAFLPQFSGFPHNRVSCECLILIWTFGSIKITSKFSVCFLHYPYCHSITEIYSGGYTILHHIFLMLDSNFSMLLHLKENRGVAVHCCATEGADPDFAHLLSLLLLLIVLSNTK